MNTQPLITFILVITIIVVIIAFPDCFRSESKKAESFLDYQDVKTKTLNWCNKMHKNGLLTSEQYNQCVSSFRDVSSNGQMNSGLTKSKTGMNYEYSLYNTNSNKQSLTSSITNTNSNTILLANTKNTYLGINTNGIPYWINDINDNKVNQREIKFVLKPLSGTTYSILSPYGGFLIANSDYTVGFTGKSAGPLASWNIIKINDALSTYENMSKIMIESVQFPNYHLVYDNNINQLVIKYGTTDEMVWYMGTLQNNENSNNTVSITSPYYTNKSNLLNIYKENYMKKLAIQSCIDALSRLSNMISNNINEIKNHIRKYLNTERQKFQLSTIDYNTRIDSINGNSLLSDSSKKELLSTIPKPIGIDIKDDNISQVLNAMENKKNTLLQDLNSNGIIPLQQQLSELMQNDKSLSDYDDFITKLNTELMEMNNKISQNNLIINRQRSEYESINTNYENQKNKMRKLEDVNKISNLNKDLLYGYQSQRTYMNKIYPFLIVFLAVGFFYLTYLTYLKFIDNVWVYYKE